MASSKMLNLERVLARLATVPAAVQKAVGDQLKTEVAGLVTAIQRNAPVDEASDNPGELRDSVHFYANPDRPLSYRVLADARDKAGKFIGSNVEAGHRARDGSHVPARPFFFPTYRALKKPIKRRVAAAGRKAAKQAFPE
jgi:hypothetical protein